MLRKYAEVIIDNRSSSTDRPYTYIIEPDMVDEIEIGMRVLIPFGQGNKLIKGVVIDIKDSVDTNYKLKSIIDVLDDKPLISKELIELSLWMSKKYLCSYMDAIRTVLPPGDFKEIKTYIKLISNDSGNNAIQNNTQREIINLLKNNQGIVELEAIKNQIKYKNINKDIKYLQSIGIVETSMKIETSIQKKYEKYVSLIDKSVSYEEMINIIGNRSHKQLEIVKFLLGIDEISLKDLLIKTNSSLYTVKSLEKKNIINIFDKEVFRTPIRRYIESYDKYRLTNEQKKCFDSIMNNINSNSGKNEFLIHGVTGSGKTEIYLQLVEEMIKRGKETIVLVPEISLTPQTIDRFVGRFGEDVAVLHSKLSFGERFDEWRKIKEGKVKIVVGARSAIFAPFNNLGLIIIDEEHESTYKSGMSPKYNAIEVAEKRCEQLGAYLVRGSATPSVDSYYKSQNNDIVLLELKERINGKKLPDIKVIDMREELNDGNNTIFSRELYNSIKLNLMNGKQTILFLNRRGHSTFVSCRKCGYVVKCNECSVAMTYHLKENKLKCHYCGLAINPPKICPVCKSKYIKYFGIGTQKVEEFTKQLFPNAVIKRMDMDTTSQKGSYDMILEKMKNNKIDILIGTQMIAKGLDFKNVTLVGIIAADISLNLPDFRSSERTFQLITQVAGRAGRGEFDGKVIIQTYNPEHYSIQYAKDYDYKSFYSKEILIRREFDYPPFTNIISIVLYGEDIRLVEMKSKEVYNVIIEEMKDNGLDNIIDSVTGPFPAPLEKIRRNYRYQIIIKCQDEYIDKLKDIIKWVCILNGRKIELEDIKFNIDINPNLIL